MEYIKQFGPKAEELVENKCQPKGSTPELKNVNWYLDSNDLGADSGPDFVINGNSSAQGLKIGEEVTPSIIVPGSTCWKADYLEGYGWDVNPGGTSNITLPYPKGIFQYVSSSELKEGEESKKSGEVKEDQNGTYVVWHRNSVNPNNKDDPNSKPSPEEIRSTSCLPTGLFGIDNGEQVSATFKVVGYTNGWEFISRSVSSWFGTHTSGKPYYTYYPPEAPELSSDDEGKGIIKNSDDFATITIKSFPNAKINLWLENGSYVTFGGMVQIPDPEDQEKQIFQITTNADGKAEVFVRASNIVSQNENPNNSETASNFWDKIFPKALAVKIKPTSTSTPSPTSVPATKTITMVAGVADACEAPKGSVEIKVTNEEKPELPKPTISPISIINPQNNEERSYNTEANSDNELYPGDYLKAEIGFRSSDNPPKNLDNIDFVLQIPDNTYPVEGSYSNAIYDTNEKTLTWKLNKNDIESNCHNIGSGFCDLSEEFSLGLANSIPIEIKTINLNGYTKFDDSDEKKYSDEVKLDIWGLITGKMVSTPDEQISNAYVTLVKKAESGEYGEYNDIEHNYTTETGETRNFQLTKENGSFELKFNRNKDLDTQRKYRLALKMRNNKEGSEATINFSLFGYKEIESQLDQMNGYDDKEVAKLRGTQSIVFVPQEINNYKITDFDPRSNKQILKCNLNDASFNQQIIEYPDSSVNPYMFNTALLAFMHWWAAQKAIDIAKQDFRIEINRSLNIVYSPNAALFYDLNIPAFYYPSGYGKEVHLRYEPWGWGNESSSIYSNEKMRNTLLWHEMGHYVMDNINFPDKDSVIERTYSNPNFIRTAKCAKTQHSHGGFANSDSSDSVMEGWAEFFYIIVYNATYNETTSPWTLYDFNSLNPIFSGAKFEKNDINKLYYSSFSPQKSVEDFVFSSLLWRLYKGIDRNNLTDNNFSWLKNDNVDNINIDYSLAQNQITFSLEEIANLVLGYEVNSFEILYNKLITNEKNKNTQNEIGLSYINQLYLIFGIFSDSNKNIHFDFDSDDKIGYSGNTVPFEIKISNYTIGETKTENCDPRPWREFPPINFDWSIKTNFQENGKTVDSADKKIKLNFVFPEEYSFNNYQAEVPILGNGTILFNLPTYFSPYKVIATTEGSSDYFYVTSEDYFGVISSNLSFNYLAEKTFNLDGSTPPTVDEIIAKEAEKNKLKPLPITPINNITPSETSTPTPASTSTTAELTPPTQAPTKDISIPTPIPEKTEDKDISIPAPVLSLTDQDELGKEIPRDNNKLKAGESIDIKVENLTDAKKVEVYLDNKKIAESPILGGDFSFNVTPPGNTMIGTHTIKLLADNGKSAEAKIKITENNWFNKTTGVILLIVALVAAMFCFIIPIIKNNLHNFGFRMR